MREKRKAGQVSSINTRRLRLLKKKGLHDYRPSVCLFWAQSHSPLFSPLCLNVIREVTSYLAIYRLLPGIFGGRLYVVNACFETFRAVPIENLLWEITLLVDDTTAICLAWNETAYSVHLLDMLTLGLRELPALQASYSHWPSSCYLSKILYVFLYDPSGYNIYKYCTSQKLWFPPTQVQLNYTISVLAPHNSSIYLFFYYATYQIFDTLTDQLGSSIALPRGLQLYRNCPCVKSAEGKLLCLGMANTLWTWDWQSDAASYTFEVPKGRAMPDYQGVTLFLGKEMYWLGCHTQLIYKFNIETLEKRTAKMVLEE